MLEKLRRLNELDLLDETRIRVLMALRMIHVLLLGEWKDWPRDATAAELARFRFRRSTKKAN